MRSKNRRVWKSLWASAAGWLDAAAALPTRADRILLFAWIATRLILLLGMIVGAHFCDPQFYKYAGEFAAGRLPYRDFSVEYPPVAMLLLLLPALPLLPFTTIAPRPDAAFVAAPTHLPMPDPLRYGVYGFSFGVEMLLVDVLTLALVRLVASRLIPGDRYGLKSGLAYLALVFASGALLQKFDLAAGTLCLAAIFALMKRQTAIAWITLALATLIKGFPVLLVPIFLAYLIAQADTSTVKASLLAVWKRLAAGLVWFGATLAAWTLLVVATAGWGAVSGTILYHAHRGIEIESLFANAQLLVGWLPGLAVHTDFSPGDLSRVVHSALDGYADATSAVLVVALTLLGYLTVWLALRRVGHAQATVEATVEATVDDASVVCERASQRDRVLLAGSAILLLAFTLSFLALPAHYLLVVVPLLACIRLPSRRSLTVLFSAVAAVAILGQVVIAIWPSLRDLEPWAVAILTARNLAWLAVYGALVVAVMRWPAVVPALVAAAAGQRRRAAALSAWARLVAADWRRRLRHAPPIPGFTPRGEDVFPHVLANVSPLRIVLACGLTTTLVYLGLVAAFPLTLWWSHPHATDNPNIINDMGRITGYSPVAAFGFVLAIAALFGAQFFAFIAAGRVERMTGDARLGRIVRWCVIGFPLVFALIMIWMQPVTTTDLYGYVARGYLQTRFHENPMITKASLLPGGLSVDRPEAPYGPIWLLITAGVSIIAGENLFLNMLLFKVISALAAVAAFILVDWLARRLYPERRLQILVLFGWSPLLLFESIGNGHNDIVMMVCVLVAFACMLRGRARTAFTLLVLGALVKYVSAVFVALWLVYEIRHLIVKPAISEPPGTVDDGRRRHTRGLFARATTATMRAVGEIDHAAAFRLLASVTVIGLALVVAAYAPYWAGFNTFKGLGQQLRPLYYNGSIVGILAAPLQIFVPSSQWPALDKTVRLVFYTLFALYAFVQIRRLWALRYMSDIRDVITASAKITFAALVLITFWFQPWYVIWLLPLAPLANDPFVLRQGTVLAMGALLTYAVSNFLLIGESNASRDLFVQFFQIIVTFAPLLFLRAASAERGWFSIVRRYLGSLGAGLTQHPVFWERTMLTLVLIVAAMLRLLRLGNLFAPLPTGSAEISTLKEISSDLKLVLTDPQGLHGPFVAIQKALVYVFGPTPFAALLPSAVIGTVTVYVIYLLAREILRQGQWKGAATISLLAALLAATSRWHVSLSRSGMEVILLPLLMCTATLWLLMALRLSGAAHATQGEGESEEAQDSPQSSLQRRAILLFVGCGICTGLACDLAPGLWLLPMLVLTFLIVWRLRHPHLFTYWRQQLFALIGAALISGLPTIGYFTSSRVGLPPGSPLLARSSVQAQPGPGIFSPTFWGQVLRNIGDVLRLLISQDYTSGYPAVGGSPIIPVLLAPIFILGLIILLVRWRNPAALALLLLTALPIAACIAIGEPTGVIEAASVLPATCIIPAVALYAFFSFLGHLPIVFDRLSGVRIFTTPEQIGRILLLLFLLVSTIRTFFWYFEATLPTRTGTQQSPSWTVPSQDVADAAQSENRITAHPPGAPGWEIVRK